MISLLAIIILALASCKKESTSGGTTPPPTSNKRVVKYEVTGTYSNKLFLVFTAVNAGLDNATTTLPWTKEITYNTTVAGIGIGGNSVTPTNAADAGKTITIKIYSGGTLVKTSTSTADANGIVNLSTVPFVF